MSSSFQTMLCGEGFYIQPQKRVSVKAHRPFFWKCAGFLQQMMLLHGVGDFLAKDFINFEKLYSDYFPKLAADFVKIASP